MGQSGDLDMAGRVLEGDGRRGAIGDMTVLLAELVHVGMVLVADLRRGRVDECGGGNVFET